MGRAESEGKMANVAQNPWTPEEDELLRKLARSGESVMNITERLNRSDHSVRTRAVRLNIVLAKSRTLKLRNSK